MSTEELEIKVERRKRRWPRTLLIAGGAISLLLVVAWFVLTKIQKQWITKPAGFTANTAILSSGEFAAAAPYNAAFAASLDHVRDFWNVPVFGQLLAPAQQHLGEALDGKKSPKEALDEIAKEQEEILRDAGLIE